MWVIMHDDGLVVIQWVYGLDMWKSKKDGQVTGCRYYSSGLLHWRFSGLGGQKTSIVYLRDTKGR